MSHDHDTRFSRNNITSYTANTIEEFDTFLERVTDENLLKTLNLSKLGTDLTPQHLDAASKKFKNLTELNVSGCNLYPQNELEMTQDVSSGLTSLIRGNPGLTKLNVSYCWEIDDSLKDTLRGSNIKYLNIESCYGIERLTERGALRAALPTAHIIDINGLEMKGRQTSHVAQLQAGQSSQGRGGL